MSNEKDTKGNAPNLETKGKPLRARTFEYILYIRPEKYLDKDGSEQVNEHETEREFLNWLDLDNTRESVRHCWIEHDRDKALEDDDERKVKKGDPIKPHVHLIIQFDSPRTQSSAEKYLKNNGVSFAGCNPKNNTALAMMYLLHGTFASRFKEPYYITELKGDEEFISNVLGVNPNKSTAQRFAEILYNNKSTSVREVFNNLVESKDTELITFFMKAGTYATKLICEENAKIKHMEDFKNGKQ